MQIIIAAIIGYTVGFIFGTIGKRAESEHSRPVVLSRKELEKYLQQERS